MFTISRGKSRLEAEAPLTEADFRAAADQMGKPTVSARKIGYVAAKRAKSEQAVETRWNGRETINPAHPGDWLVTNLTPQRKVLRDHQGHVNTYVIAADRFTDLYERAGGRNSYGIIYRAKGLVEALAVPGGFDVLAPWGERQTATAGFLLLNGGEVYGCHAEAFAATYEVLPS